MEAHHSEPGGPRPRGHLFVVHGDLTKLHCDGLLVPCDSSLNVSGWWAPVLPHHESVTFRGWIRPTGAALDKALAVLEAVDELPARVLVDTVGTARGSTEEMVEVTLRGLDALAGMKPGGGRELPLVAMPMVGTGEGTHQSRRGEVASLLIPRVSEWCRVNQVDVAIVLNDKSAYHAVQSIRARGEDEHHMWTSMSTPSAADQLGRLAASGGLSLFVGAGASRSLGLPDWDGLLGALWELAFNGSPMPHDGHLAIGQQIRQKLGDNLFETEMVSRFKLQRYGLGHGLLASMGVRQNITTNYDNALELAMSSTSREVRVLTREEPERDLSWVLKIHGDIEKPNTLVLSTADYDRLGVEGKPLYGVLHSLLLTSHLLFVGFGFGDADFLQALDEVKRTRNDIESPSKRATLATTVTLAADAARKFPPEIEKISMVEAVRDATAAAHAARELEVFLDRVAMTAATQGDSGANYLLDPAYELGLTTADQELASELSALAAKSPLDRASHPGWARFHLFLTSLGQRERAEPK